MKISLKQIPILIFGSLIILLGFNSCSTKSSKNPTNISGWGTNDKEGWLFTGTNQSSNSHDGMVFVKGGMFIVGKVSEDILMDYINAPVRTNVQSFFIAENEVTNYDYLQYTSWLEYVFSDNKNSGSKSILNSAIPNNKVWGNNSANVSKNYFSHPAYSYYPVVGVSWNQAQRYCEWLTDRVNEKKLMDKGIIKNNLYSDPNLLNSNNLFSSSSFEKNPKELTKDSLSIIDSTKLYSDVKHKPTNSRAIYKSYGNNVVTKFRLPSESEWEYAATGIVSKTNSKEDSKINIYKGEEVFYKQILGKKNTKKGIIGSNLKKGIGNGDHSLNRISSTTSVKSMPANDYGIYGMYGNVSEWVNDTYKIVTRNENSNFPSIGFDNEIESLESINNSDSIAIDSLSENVVDSDARSKVKKSKDLTSYVNENSKVIKGASWRDNSYWIDPGHRRFMSSNKSNNWVGFRVAQDNSN